MWLSRVGWSGRLAEGSHRMVPRCSQNNPLDTCWTGERPEVCSMIMQHACFLSYNVLSLRLWSVDLGSALWSLVGQVWSVFHTTNIPRQLLNCPPQGAHPICSAIHRGTCCRSPLPTCQSSSLRYLSFLSALPKTWRIAAGCHLDDRDKGLRRRRCNSLFNIYISGYKR